METAVLKIRKHHEKWINKLDEEELDVLLNISKKIWKIMQVSSSKKSTIIEKIELEMEQKTQELNDMFQQQEKSLSSSLLQQLKDISQQQKEIQNEKEKKEEVKMEVIKTTLTELSHKFEIFSDKLSTKSKGKSFRKKFENLAEIFTRKIHEAEIIIEKHISDSRREVSSIVGQQKEIQNEREKKEEVKMGVIKTALTELSHKFEIFSDELSTKSKEKSFQKNFENLSEIFTRKIHEAEIIIEKHISDSRREVSSIVDQKTQKINDIYEIKTEKIMQHLGEILAKKNSTELGKEFEKNISDFLHVSFPLNKIEDVSKISRSGDIIFTMDNDKTKVMIETKNYSGSIPKKEIDKFKRDLLQNHSYEWGIFITSSSPISGKKMLGFEDFENGKKIIWLPSINNNLHLISYAIYLIKNIIQIERKYSDKSVKKLDMKDINFNTFVKKQCDIYLELNKMMEIFSDKREQINNIINTMFDEVHRKQLIFVENMEFLKDYYHVDFIGEDNCQTFMKHVPNSIFLLGKIKTKKIKWNVQLKTIKIGNIEIKFGKDKYLLSGSKIGKIQEIKKGNELLIISLLKKKYCKKNIKK